MMSQLDYEKIIGYARQFNQWKQELFPREEYAYRNGCCFAFAHLLAEKAKAEGYKDIRDIIKNGEEVKAGDKLLSLIHI